MSENNDQKIWNKEALHFRISRDGFMIKIPEGTRYCSAINLELVDVEQILQAVRKTQQKLLNKEIQKIQDSKNNELKPFNIIKASITVQDENGLEVTFDNRHINKIELIDNSENKYQDLPLEKIEQNQKIVDVLVRVFKVDRDIDYTTLPQEIKKATGKDIKDL